MSKAELHHYVSLVELSGKATRLQRELRETLDKLEGMRRSLEFSPVLDLLGTHYAIEEVSTDGMNRQYVIQARVVDTFTVCPSDLPFSETESGN